MIGPTGEPVVLKENPELYEQPEEPMSIGTLLSFAAGVLAVGALFMFVGSRVLAQFLGRAGSAPFSPSDPNYINPDPNESLPNSQECLDRFQRAMGWVNDGTITRRDEIPEARITIVDGGCLIPDTMKNLYTAADMTIALKDPTRVFLFFDKTTEKLLTDPNATFGSEGVGFLFFGDMNNLEFYKDDIGRPAVFQVVKELERRFLKAQPKNPVCTKCTGDIVFCTMPTLGEDNLQEVQQ